MPSYLRSTAIPLRIFGRASASLIALVTTTVEESPSLVRSLPSGSVLRCPPTDTGWRELRPAAEKPVFVASRIEHDRVGIWSTRTLRRAHRTTAKLMVSLLQS